MHELLQNITYLGKKCFLTFWVPIFSCPKLVTDVKTACIWANKSSFHFEFFFEKSQLPF